jgi:hypothetical protein
MFAGFEARIRALKAETEGPLEEILVAVILKAAVVRGDLVPSGRPNNGAV